MNAAIDLDVLKAAADAALQVQEELDAATAVEVKAKSVLLDTIVESVRGSLRAICGRVRVSERVSGLATGQSREFRELSTWRGVRVAGDGVEEDYPHCNTGSYEGDALYLREDGTFVKLTYSGSWSRWQGSSSEWEATVKERDLAQVAVAYDVGEIAKVLAEKLQAVVDGGAKTRAREKRERAEQFAAIAKLVGGGK